MLHYLDELLQNSFGRDEARPSIAEKGRFS